MDNNKKNKLKIKLNTLFMLLNMNDIHTHANKTLLDTRQDEIG